MLPRQRQGQILYCTVLLNIRIHVKPTKLALLKGTLKVLKAYAGKLYRNFFEKSLPGEGIFSKNEEMC